jgi:hypothetical protein
MADLNGFDASQEEPAITFDALPAGWYDVIITESDMEATKAGDGKFLKLKLQVVGGQFDGRTLFDRLNLDNPNAVAVQIARGTLSSICRAVNILTPKDSSQLHNLPLQAKVAQKLYEGEMRNEVKGYKPKGGATASAATGTGGGPSLSQVGPAAPKPAAWLRKT